MFDGVEYIYKKNSMLNKAARKSLNIYFIIMIVTACSIQFLYKTFNLPILVNIFLIIFLIVFLGTLILCIFFKKLGAKFTFKFKTNKNNIFKAIMDAEKHDIILIREWLIKNNCYNIDCVKIYMNHYQNLNIRKERNSNFGLF